MQVGQQVWSELRCSPRTVCERCHCLADGQWSPLKKGRVKPSRKASSLEGDCEICFGPQAHHGCEARQRAPKVSIFSPGRKSGPQPPAIGVRCALDISRPAMSQNEP